MSRLAIKEYPNNLLRDAFKGVVFNTGITSDLTDKVILLIGESKSPGVAKYLEDVYKYGIDQKVVLSVLGLPETSKHSYQAKCMKELRQKVNIFKRGTLSLKNVSYDELKAIEVEDLFLTDYATEALKAYGFNTFYDLICCTDSELTKKGLNRGLINKVERALGYYSLKLREDPLVMIDGVADFMDYYPFNLAYDIFGDKTKCLSIVPTTLIELIEVSNGFGLSERELKVILLRYKDKLTLKGIGDVFGVTVERIRQIEAKALRKLRCHTRMGLLKTISLREHYEIIDDLKNDICVLEEENEALKLENDTLRMGVGVESCVSDERSAGTRLLMTPLDDLGLSVRTYNCLTRRTDFKTLGDIVALRDEEIMSIRGFGNKCRLELNQLFKKYDIDRSVNKVQIEMKRWSI